MGISHCIYRKYKIQKDCLFHIETLQKYEIPNNNKIIYLTDKSILLDAPEEISDPINFIFLLVFVRSS